MSVVTSVALAPGSVDSDVGREVSHDTADSGTSRPAPAILAERLAALEVSQIGDDEALTVMSECERLIAFAHSVQVRALARFAQLRSATAEFVADEIAPVMSWTRNAAAGRVGHATDLTTRMPAVVAALESGRLDLYRTRILTEDTVALTASRAAAVAAQVLPRAQWQNPTAFRRSVRRAILRVDPDGQARRHDTARTDRRIVVHSLPDGMAELTATLSAEVATAIYQRVDLLARGQTRDRGRRSADARRADVFAALLLSDTKPHHAASAGVAVRPLVQVTIAATTLAGADDAPAELSGYGPVPAAMARRIAHDPTGVWRRLVTDPVDGSLLDYGRRTYRPPAALADHVRARDRTCRFPGCHHPARGADLDHTVPYPHGPTAAGNLAALCRRHHRLKHKTQWTVTQRGGQFTWTSPTGRRHIRYSEFRS